VEEEEVAVDPLLVVVEEEEAAADPLLVVAAEEEAVAVAEEAEALLQPLALLRTAMEDQTRVSKGTPPLSLMGINQKANNS
jgi:hypothetical protein